MLHGVMLQMSFYSTYFVPDVLNAEFAELHENFLYCNNIHNYVKS